jgi:hypothetical protein
MLASLDPQLRSQPNPDNDIEGAGTVFTATVSYPGPSLACFARSWPDIGHYKTQGDVALWQMAIDESQNPHGRNLAGSAARGHDCH